jgi:hypothetical protein
VSTVVTKRLRAAGVVALAGLAALAGSLAAERLVGAEASHEDPCANADLTQAVFNVTGVVPIGKVCNTGLFNEGEWSSLAELEGHVTTIMDRCASFPGGGAGGNRYLVQAIIEITGVPPSDGACDRQVYEDFVDDTFGTSHAINWNQYKGSTTTVESVFDAVDLTFSTCDRKWISQAVIEVEGAYPDTRYDQRPAGSFSGNGLNGQCNPWLYDNGAIWRFDRLKENVQARANAGACSTIGNPQATQISNAYLAITGWYPSPPLGECNPSLYGAGSWADDTELRTRIYHSWFCRHGNIGQIFWFSKGRRVEGRQFSGECNPLLYEDGTGVPGATPAARYQELETRLGVTTTSLATADIVLDGDGDALVNGTFVPSDEIVIGNNGTGDFRFGDGNQLPSGLSIPPAQATQIAAGNFVATNGGTLIGQAGTNLIGQAGTNVIASGGGNVIASGGGN